MNNNIKNMERFKWSIINDNKLKILYPNNLNDYIAKTLNTTISSIENRAYKTAIDRKLLNQVCNHMIKVNYSTPQLILKKLMDKLLSSNGLYNDRKTIKPYEIDLYYPEYKLGFEYQGKLWHSKKYNNGRDELKLIKLTKKNINVIFIIQDTKDYEKDIKLQIIKELELINQITNLNICEEDVLNCIIENVFNDIYNKDELLTIAKKYNTFKEFLNKERSCYNKLKKLNIHHEATSHMTNIKINHNINEVDRILKKYKTLSDLIKNDWGIYQYIKRNNLDYLITELESKNKKLNLNIEEIKVIISKYDNKCSFIKENKRIYGFLKKRKLLSLLSTLRNCTGLKNIN